MGTFRRAGLTVKIDFKAATLSVWTPGAWYRGLQVLGGLAVLAGLLWFRRRVPSRGVLITVALALGAAWSMLLGPAVEAPTYVFLAPMQRSLGWSKTELTGAFSVALATSAVAAFPVGRWLDRHSPRPLMTFADTQSPDYITPATSVFVHCPSSPSSSPR